MVRGNENHEAMNTIVVNKISCRFSTADTAKVWAIFRRYKFFYLAFVTAVECVMICIGATTTTKVVYHRDESPIPRGTDSEVSGANKNEMKKKKETDFFFAIKVRGYEALVKGGAHPLHRSLKSLRLVLYFFLFTFFVYPYREST